MGESIAGFASVFRLEKVVDSSIVVCYIACCQCSSPNLKEVNSMALFGKSKGGAKEKDTLLKLLAFIVAGTQGAAAHAVVPNVLAEKIEKLEPGLIAKQTGAEVDPAGNIAVYATSKGVAAVGGDGAATPSQPAAVQSPYALEKGIPMPVSKRGGAKSTLYPFESAVIGDSFFVPATEDKPNPAKALASTCSSASKRYAKTGRKFVVRKITDSEGKVTGARCFCIAPEAAA
jgi:hypothetical protein